MCLNIVEEVPESMCEGQAIKYLRKNEDSSCRPEWPYFREGGGGKDYKLKVQAWAWEGNSQP